MEIKDLKQDTRNYRKHNTKNLNLIKKSIEETGLGRSICIDNQNEIISGNGLVSQLPDNTPIKVIETDGKELIVVKRTDLNTNDEKRKKLAVMDNSTSDSSSFDMELLSIDFDNIQLEDMGIEFDSLGDSEIDMPELASGDKEPYQQMTFTLADEQAEKVKEAIAKVKQSENYKYIDTMGNENSNGNAIYCIIMEWLNGKC